MVERGKKSLDFDRDELKREIKEELKKELRAELKLSDKDSSEKNKLSKTSFEDKVIQQNHPDDNYLRKKSSRKGLKMLIILVLIVLIIDGFVFYFYFKPNFGFLNNIKNSASKRISNLVGNVVKNVNNIGGEKCSDGTKYGECSDEKPLYCYEGNLVEMAYTCGCPEGYDVSFQICKKISS